MQTDSFYLTFMQIVASWYSFSYKVFSVLFAHVRWKPRIMAGSLAPAIFTVFHWSIQHARPVQADCSKFPSISLFRLSKEQFWGSDWNFKALTPASQYSTTCSAAESAAFCQVFFRFLEVWAKSSIISGSKMRHSHDSKLVTQQLSTAGTYFFMAMCRCIFLGQWLNDDICGESFIYHQVWISNNLRVVQT